MLSLTQIESTSIRPGSWQLQPARYFVASCSVENAAIAECVIGVLFVSSRLRTADVMPRLRLDTLFAPASFSTDTRQTRYAYLSHITGGGLPLLRIAKRYEYGFFSRFGIFTQHLLALAWAKSLDEKKAYSEIKLINSTVGARKQVGKNGFKSKMNTQDVHKQESSRILLTYVSWGFLLACTGMYVSVFLGNQFTIFKNWLCLRTIAYFAFASKEILNHQDRNDVYHYDTNLG